jgi:hypothetical protein
MMLVIQYSKEFGLAILNKEKYLEQDFKKNIQGKRVGRQINI